MIEKKIITECISADFNEVDRFCSKVLSSLRDRDLMDYNFDIQLLLREALNNAVVHGSGRDPEKKIKITVEIGAKKVIMDIEDSGPGFDWEPLLKKSEIRSENKAGVSGRGMPILKKYASNISFNKTGNHLVLIKELRGRSQK